MEPLFIVQPLLHASSWEAALALYGGGFFIGALFAGIAFGLDGLATKHNIHH